MLVAMVEWVAGFQARVDGITFAAPRLPEEWEGLTLTRTLGDTQYVLTIEKGGATGVTVDGEALAGDRLPYRDSDVPIHIVVRV